MEQIKKFFAHKIFKILKWAFFVLVAFYIILVIVRAFHMFDVEKTNKQVQVIHSTKITIDDALGNNLPPDPGLEADKTVEGVDANKNGIRDDVELAIFKTYPDSAKTRAALLQYSLTTQMMVIQPFLNTITATAVVEEYSRAGDCLADSLVPRKSPESFREYSDLEEIDRYTLFVEELQFNTTERKNKENSFYELVRSFSDQGSECDVDSTKLPN